MYQFDCRVSFEQEESFLWWQRKSGNKVVFDIKLFIYRQKVLQNSSFGKLLRCYPGFAYQMNVMISSDIVGFFCFCSTLLNKFFPNK
eukprot:UN16992